MLPIADGSDFGGSLRNPASFCNVVGFRPSSGRVPVWPTPVPSFPLLVEGPMARTVEDVALVLTAIAGPDARSPIAIAESGETFSRPLARDFTGVRLAWSDDLGGLPVDHRVTDVVNGQRQVFESLGCTVDQAAPNLRDADEVFRVWRAWYYVRAFGELLEQHRGEIKETVVWNIEEGLKLDSGQLERTEQKRTALSRRLRAFMDAYEFLILPVSQVPPFDVTQRYVTEINGIPMETYLDWMRSCYYISATGLPAISVPCGFTPDGLPIGLQIVGRHEDDFGVLQLAYAFEQATEVWKRKPPEASTSPSHAH